MRSCFAVVSPAICAKREWLWLFKAIGRIKC